MVRIVLFRCVGLVETSEEMLHDEDGRLKLDWPCQKEGRMCV